MEYTRPSAGERCSAWEGYAEVMGTLLGPRDIDRRFYRPRSLMRRSEVRRRIGFGVAKPGDSGDAAVRFWPHSPQNLTPSGFWWSHLGHGITRCLQQGQAKRVRALLSTGRNTGSSPNRGAEVHDALSYYYDHRAQIDQEIEEQNDLESLMQQFPDSLRPAPDDSD